MAVMTLIEGCVLGISAVSGGIIGLTWIAFRYWCLPKRVPSSRSPADYGLECETVQFPSKGIRLNGWFIPALQAGGSAPVVVLVHGWGHNAGRMLDLAKGLHQDGFSVLLYDGRGHGSSSGDGPSYVLKFSQDIIAAVEYLERRSDIDPRRIGVIGHSIGGAGAILSAAADKRISAVVSTSAFSDPNDLTRETLKRAHIPVWLFLPIIQCIFRRWIRMPINSISPRFRIGEISVPVLLVHGASDGFIDPVNMDILYNEADPKHVQRLLLDGCRHSDMLQNPLFFDKIKTFFSQALKPQQFGVG